MSKKLDVINPFNGELVESLTLADESAINATVAKAVAAKEGWAAAPMFKRAEIMYRYADLIIENMEDLVRLHAREMGKTIRQGRIDAITAANIVRGYTEKARHLYSDVFPADNFPGLESDFIFTVREAIGVAACVIPFNFPLDLFAHKMAPAVIMGNPVIIKAPSANPLAMLKLSELFEKAGGPAGVVQSLVCERKVCQDNLIEHPDVKIVSMTGSTATGLKMAAGGAKSLKRVFLELGGNDPTIVLDDADVDYAVEEIAFGRIYNTGQTCCACKRFLIHESLVGEFTDKLIARLKKVLIGDPLDEKTEMGTLISESAAIKVMEQIEHTVGQGAKVLYGGQRQGAVVTPTVLGGVKKSMDVAVDLEIFGPVFPIIPFSSDQEAVEIANSTRYGLQGGIITKDVVRSMRLASQLKCGCVVLNGQGNYRHIEQPFGGYKMTGIGREGISYTLEEFSQLKTMVMRRVFNK
ncbi:MAG: aldehyde dehydrogenase family protein [Candidatus Adiutrix sp.]|jgi:succinate-semialdehyde dehydrogenase/glutarate-semialdehyde dehydrogenase|nr:aldehyde dehydrogenase family protein [Candidatus Adiutrix sp.]